MIDLGTTLYLARIDSNVFKKHKHTLTDDAGNVWYRYDRPDYEYSITPIVVVGRLSSTLEWSGEPRQPTPETVYYMSDDSEWDESDINRTGFNYSAIFTTKSLAESYINKHRESVK